MNLKSITIKNYRSIEKISFDTDALADDTYTYGLIGVNEVGKSTILKAIALKDGLKNQKGETLPLQKDFRVKDDPIEIEYEYVLDKAEIKEAKEYLLQKAPDADFKDSDLSRVVLTALFEYSSPSNVQYVLEIKSMDEGDALREQAESHLEDFIVERVHTSIFWTAEDRYLISQPINLAQFAENPEDISIPLKNCFALAGFDSKEAIKEKISLITESTEREALKDELGRQVTKHINDAWPKHPIKITFDISDGLINFHVHDSKAKGKAKTADQRSDGFGQFVSFLLTVSAQNKNEELADSILLLDEPETHLHPQAQEDLLKDVVKITQNSRNNIAFFATHSNYMIDKKDLSRTYKITKPKDATEKERFDQKGSTYASVTFEVFDIPSTDYHNELYARLHESYQDADTSDADRVHIKNFDENFLAKKGLKKDKPWKGKANSATLPTYIRNCIHHPDNGDTYEESDLRHSIELLRSYL